MDPILIIRIPIAILLATILLRAVARWVPADLFRQMPWYFLAAAASLFWGVLATLLVLTAWESYYRYFVPQWSRWLAPLAAVTYFFISSGLRWLSLRLGGSSSSIFVLLGGLESIPEHAWAIYGAGIMEIPMFRGTSPSAIFLFAFFEYLIFWSLVLFLAALMFRFWRRRAEP